MPGGVSNGNPVLSGVPHGNVLGPLLFIIMISRLLKLLVLKMILEFILVLFRLFAEKFKLYLLMGYYNNKHSKILLHIFSSSLSSINTNVYFSPSLDLGINMSRYCSFDVHINILCKKFTDLSGWILRTLHLMRVLL